MFGSLKASDNLFIHISNLLLSVAVDFFIDVKTQRSVETLQCLE